MNNPIQKYYTILRLKNFIQIILEKFNKKIISTTNNIYLITINIKPFLSFDTCFSRQFII